MARAATGVRQKPTMLSIDWDFFTFNGELDGDQPIINPETGEPDTYPGFFLYDWGHSEGHGEGLARIMWSSRVCQFERLGLRLEDQCCIREDKGGIQPHVFTDKLRERWATCGRLYMADSHSWGNLAASELRCICRKPLHVVHFDAHHDLGYGQGWDINSEGWDCGNWLHAGLLSGWIGSVEIVYPDWRGLTEWQAYGEEIERPWLAQYDIRVTTWSDWASRRYKQLPLVAGAFLCRSSNWTPPYLDPLFGKLAHTLSDWSAGTTCFDCSEDHKVGAYNACKPREGWDEIRASGEAQAEATTKFLAEQRAKEAV